jgi:hypothetical protein
MILRLLCARSSRSLIQLPGNGKSDALREFRNRFIRAVRYA